MTRPLLAPTLALSVLALALAAPALPQAAPPEPPPPSGPSRGEVSGLLIDELREADLIAVLVLTWEEEKLCASLGIPARPRAPKVGNFNLVRFLDHDGSERSRRLKFDFPKKGEKNEEGVTTWRACLVEEPRVGAAEKDEVHVTVREADQGGMRGTERFLLRFPTADLKTKLSLRRDQTGKLYASSVSG